MGLICSEHLVMIFEVDMRRFGNFLFKKVPSTF